ncbi:NDUFA9 [Cordylochernes scorpioides]|uniref:NADH dehydrogenase [ubiquinone] 1 alpha subcomplex subunit 9, mitochondrial n=1 Tax=Cordylochernes scorpioides TaxID=51811 RepID=A0ABY6LBA1_9ARAC|nr:NDUFA9 [Cordylochernes scorpioides]
MSSASVNPDNQSAFKRGTGGRSSFNGVVATVFGATGYLGRTLMPKLGKIGTQVIVPYRDDEYRIMPLKVCGDLGQILFSPFHLRDEESLYKVMKYSNVVINIINKPQETPNFTYNDVHVEGSRRIARIAKECGVKRLIHCSIMNASPDPPAVIMPKGSDYIRSKVKIFSPSLPLFFFFCYLYLTHVEEAPQQAPQPRADFYRARFQVGEQPSDTGDHVAEVVQWYGEQAVLEEFPEATIFRPCWSYGLERGLFAYYMSRWRRFHYTIYLWNKGKGIYKYPLFVSDLAQGIVNASLDPSSAGKIYQAMGPHRYELNEMVNYIFNLVVHPYQIPMAYSIKDLRRAYHYCFNVTILSCMSRMIVKMHETVSTRGGVVSWDKLEVEHSTEEYDPNLPTLLDLGVKLTSIEDRFMFESKFYRPWVGYEPEFGEIDMDQVPLPKRAPFY